MAASADTTEGMDYLERLPRRVFTLYLPLSVFLFVLLFPFYWMTTTTFKPDDELYDYARFNPFWVAHPTLEHIKKLFFETSYPSWLINTMVVSVAATAISLFCSVCAAYAIERLRFSGARYVGLAIFLAYLVPPSILFIPLAAIIFKIGLFDSDWALILTYPTFLMPFCTWLLMGYFRTIPYELEECALIDGATRLQILWKITLPLAGPWPDLGRHFRLHAVLERVYLRADLHLVVGEQDGSSRRHHRTGRRRRLSLGFADGGGAVRFAAGGDHVLVFRRVLRLEPDRGGQGIAAAGWDGRLAEGFPPIPLIGRARRTELTSSSRPWCTS